MFKQSSSPPRRSSRWFTLVGLCLTLVLLAACDSGQSKTPPTPTTNQYVPLQLGIPTQALNAPITGSVPDSQLLHVDVTFALDQATLNQFGQSNTAKPGQTTSGNEIASKLGISNADYQKIKDFFGVSDANLTLSSTHTSLGIDIKAGEVAKIFQTKLVYHTLNGNTYYTPDPQHMPQIPAVLATKILAVTGLDSYSQAPKTGLTLANQQTSQADKASDFGLCPLNVPLAVGRDQVANSYGFDQLWRRGWKGQNATIDLIEIDGVSQSDLNTYFSCVNYKGKVTYTTVNGKAPAPEGETTLDMDMIAGLAPDVNIHDYQTDLGTTNDSAWRNLLDTFQRVIDDHEDNLYSEDVVSISLGIPEDDITLSMAQALNQRLQIMTQVEHLTVFVASGDCAAFMDGVYGRLAVSFPASSPYATAVGGTELQTDLAGTRQSETSWSDSSDKKVCNNSWGTGGGLSTFFAQPAWQTGVNGIKNQYSNGKRQLPDVAAVADNLMVFFQGTWQPIGGTSAATPIWATAMTLLNQGFIATKGYYAYGSDTFYSIKAHARSSHPYFEITSGTNLYYKAGPGWNYTTGLGTPYLPDFLAIEQATAP